MRDLQVKKKERSSSKKKQKKLLYTTEFCDVFLISIVYLDVVTKQKRI